nr:unnamed protein product [Spodoptera littoralis]
MKGITLLLLCAVAAAQANDRIIPRRNLILEKKIEKDGQDGFSSGNQEAEKVPKQVFRVNSDPSQAPAICAAEGSDAVLVAHENCNQFYKCYRGEPAALDCPPNLLYNPEREYCDWEWNVDCSNRIKPDDISGGNPNEDKGPDHLSGGNSDPSQAPAICAAEGSNGVLVAHENCNQFYKCYRGEPAALDCPPNLLYNPDKEYCDWSWNVDCGNRVIPSEKLIAEKELGQDVRSQSPGEPAALDCPQNLLYNPEREYCDWEWNVDCSNRIKPDDISGGNPNEDKDPDQVSGGNSDPSQAPAICAAEGSDGVLIAHENCNQFYKCFGGEPAALDCPQNLLYNPEREYCDWEWNVDCSNRIKPDDISGGKPNEDKGPEQVSGGNSDPSQAPAICAAEGSDGVLVAHENCNQFYKCYRGEPAALDCPQNLLYNPEREYCDWEWNVDCSNRIKPDDISGGNPNEDKDPDQVSGGNSDPSQAPAICAAEGSDGVLVAHENCNQFYKCYRGEPAALDCPQNLLYNPEREYCDWEWNVDCSNRIKPDDISGGKPNEDKGPEQVSGGNSDPSQAPAICAAEGSDGVLVAHENCNQFYKCYRGEPAALDCPQNLLYNPEREYCDWEWNVDCSNRIKPDDISGGNPNEDKDPDLVSGGNSDPSQAPAICAAEGSDGVLVAHENCNQFINVLVENLQHWIVHKIFSTIQKRNIVTGIGMLTVATELFLAKKM